MEWGDVFKENNKLLNRNIYNYINNKTFHAAIWIEEGKLFLLLLLFCKYLLNSPCCKQKEKKKRIKTENL